MSIPSSLTPLFNSGSSAAGYQVSRSLRFNSADSAYLSRTPAVAGNRRTWTWAGWVKRSALSSGTHQAFFGLVFGSNDASQINIHFDTTDNLRFNLWSDVVLRTTQVFRDCSAWYHVVIAFDATQGTASNRLRIYVNGTEITTFSTNNRSSLLSNQDYAVNAAQAHYIGYNNVASEYFNGYLADIHFIDGQQLTPSSFTEVSATTGQLIPKAYTGSYGTNGFKLSFSDNSTTAALGTDSSGAGNNWTVNNFSVDGVVRNYASDVTTVATSVYSGTPATMFNGGTSIYYGVTSSSGNSSISINLTGKSVSVSSSVRVYASFRTGMVWQINGSTVSSSGVTHPNTGWQTLSGWSAGAITSFSNSVPSGNANEIYAIEIDGVILTNNTGAGNDSLVDTPTSISATDTGVGGEIRGNYCTLNPLDNGGVVLSNGNLDVSNGAAHEAVRTTIKLPSTGKWYAELQHVSFLDSSTSFAFGVDYSNGSTPASWTSSNVIWINVDLSYLYIKINNTILSYVAQTTQGALLQIAYDADTQKLWLGCNNVWRDSSFGTSGNPSAGTNQTVSSVSNGFLTVNTYQATGSVNFGQRAFAYTAPSGFKALCDTNLPSPVVAKPNTVMDVALWTGNGSTQTISGLGFSPDFVWVKVRSAAGAHGLFDTVRGAGYKLVSNVTNAEAYNGIGSGGDLIAFNSDGFNLGDNTAGSAASTNLLNYTYVGWTWDAGGTTDPSNQAGSITSQVRANVSAGFSVVTYTGNNTAGATVGHGLGVAPALIINKQRSGGNNWWTYHASLGATKYLVLDLTNAAGTANTVWNDTAPTSTVFSIGVTGVTNTNSATYVNYCFAPVVGYSSFGSYVGNGSSDGPFVFCNFRPKYVLLKCSSAGDSAKDWFVHDGVRDTYNLAQKSLNPNRNIAELDNASYGIDLLSNGFKIRTTSTGWNGSAETYIYAAFAENPFQYARAR